MSDANKTSLAVRALDAALAILDEQGVQGLSTRKIAKSIGCSAGALYVHFKNLDDLCWRLNLQTLVELRAALDANNELPAAERLLACAQTYLEFARRWPQRWALLFEHRSAAQAQLPGELLQAIEAEFGRIETALAELGPGAEANVCQRAARTLWGSVHGIVVLALHDKLFVGQGTDAEIMLEELIRRYLTSWQAEGAVC